MTSRTGRQWVAFSVNERHVARLRQDFGLSDSMARLTSRRLESVDDAPAFLHPSIKDTLVDPLHLPDAQCAFDCVYDVLCHKKPLGIWGDYDVDGACASALLIRYFRALGVSTECHIPNRFREGYGPNIQGLLSMKEKGVHDVIIVDCGTSALQPLAQAKDSGMNIIVVDHHEPGPITPDVVALVNPKRLDFCGPEDLKTLCAGGLVFIFLVGLNRYLRAKGFFYERSLTEPDLMPLLDLVALSTVCDLMPLGRMNRSFIKKGEKALCDRNNRGLLSLSQSAKIRGVISAHHLAFRIGPRINAAGRLGDSSLGMRLLSSEDPVESLSIVAQLEDMNRERQKIEQNVMEQATESIGSMESKPYCLAYGDQWHEGVLGIVAGRLKDAHNVPCFVLAGKGDTYKGSARSVPGIDLAHLIQDAKEAGILLDGGGHAMAAGLSLSQDRIDAFKDFLNHFFRRNGSRTKAPSFLIEGALTIEQTRSRSFLDDLDRLAPFGPGCPLPYFVMSRVTLDRATVFAQQHLRMRLTQSNGQSCFVAAFRIADQPLGRWLLEGPQKDVDCVISVRTELFLGSKRASLFLEDVSCHPFCHAGGTSV